MKSRLTFKHSVCLGCTVALLVAVMASPIRPMRSAGASAPNCLRRNFAIPAAKNKLTRVSVRLAVSDPVQIKALASEAEEEPRSMTDAVTRLIALPPTPSIKPAQAMAVKGPSSTLHPLRC